MYIGIKLALSDVSEMEFSNPSLRAIFTYFSDRSVFIGSKQPSVKILPFTFQNVLCTINMQYNTMFKYQS